MCRARPSTGAGTLSDLEPVDQEEIVAGLADEAEASGESGPLERALAAGELLGGRDPASVPRDVCDRIARVLSKRIDANDRDDDGQPSQAA